MTIYEFAELTGKTPAEAGTLISTKYKDYIIVGEDGIHTISDDILDLPEFSSDTANNSQELPEDAVSVTELAEQLHISKQAIHQKRKRQPLSDQLKPYTITVLNKVYIYGKGLDIVRAAFSAAQSTAAAREHTESRPKSPVIQPSSRVAGDARDSRQGQNGSKDSHFTVQNAENVNSVNLQSESVNALQPILEVLTKQIDEKDLQLREKDKQIQEINSNYKSVISAFQGQLEAKDIQINQLIEQNTSLSGQLSAEQALHAGTMYSQKGLSEGEQSSEDAKNVDNFKDLSQEEDKSAEIKPNIVQEPEESTEVIRTGLNEINSTEDKSDFQLEDFPRVDSVPVKTEEELKKEIKEKMESEFRQKHPFLSKFIKSF